MIGKVRCAVPGCTMESKQDVNTQSAAYATGKTRTFAVENGGWSWVYPELGNTNTDILCPAHKGWQPEPEKEKAVQIFQCECGETTDDTKRDGFGIWDGRWYCHKCWKMSRPDRGACDQGAQSQAPEPSQREQYIRELETEVKLLDAALDYMTVLIGLTTNSTWTAMFARLRELVAKEGEQ